MGDHRSRHCFEVSQGSFSTSYLQVPRSQLQSQGWFQNSLQSGIEETCCRRYRRQNEWSWCFWFLQTWKGCGTKESKETCTKEGRTQEESSSKETCQESSNQKIRCKEASQKSSKETSCQEGCTKEEGSKEGTCESQKVCEEASSQESRFKKEIS